MCGRDHQHLFCLNKHSKISPRVCEIRVLRELVAGQGTAREAKRAVALFLENELKAPTSIFRACAWPKLLWGGGFKSPPPDDPDSGLEMHEW